MLGPTPGEQYLAYVGLDDHPQWTQIARELDDEILFVCEQVIGDWKRNDRLLRALLYDADGGSQTHTWATYPVGWLPVGTRIRYVVDANFPHSYTARGEIRPADIWDRDEKGPFITWDRDPNRPAGPPPGVPKPDDLVEAWVPIPVDLTALAGPLERPAPQARPAVTWDDLAVGRVISYRHRNRSQRLGHRAPQVRRGRILDVWYPDGAGRAPQIKVEVLNRDGTPNRTYWPSHTLYGCDANEDVVEILHRPTPTVEPQDLMDA